MNARLPADERRVRMLATPEGVPLPLELADIGQRAGAFAIDLAVLLAGLIAFSVALLFAGRAIGGDAAWRLALMLWLTGSFFARNLYFIWMEGRPRAATLGKRWTGLRVVARDGGRLTLDAVIARNALREVEFFMPLSFAAAAMGVRGFDGATIVVGLAWSLIFLLLPAMNADRLRAGDLLAGTWVIRVPRRPLLPELTGDGAAPTFTDAELDAYGVHELETLERVIREPDRDMIATVARAIRDRIGRSDYGDRGGWGDLAFLTDYYGALRARLEAQLLLGRRRADKNDRG